MNYQQGQGQASAPASGQPSNDGTHNGGEDDVIVAEFLASLMDYTPTIPDELVEHYFGRSGFQCPDVRLVRLVAVATQKFVADIAGDALQFLQAFGMDYDFKSLNETIGIVKRGRQQSLKDKRLILTMEDLSKALLWCECEASGILCRQPFYQNGYCLKR